MISRISDNARFNTIAGNISNLQDSTRSAADQLATQKRINQPSDDPEGTTIVLNLRAAGASIDQYKENIISGETWLKITELNLSSINDLVMQAQAVAQNAEGTSADRSAAADSIQNIMDQMLSLANAKLDGRYIFSGSKTDTEPFAVAVNDTPPPAHFYDYNGDNQSLNINIGQNSSTGYNIIGDAVFPASAGGGVALLETLDALKTALLSDDSAAIAAAVTDVENACQQVQQQVQDSVAKTSAMLSNLEFANNHLTYLKNLVGSMISKSEDADTAQVTMEFQMQALALNASYTVAAKMNEGSILNFLQ
ncbi:MAG: flagellar hook-associated protein FlgL [Deltaproteobacteria bacterium]|nr:flagellar hook-associated protein FlgL [Deltaproteobacteria bacterium]